MTSIHDIRVRSLMRRFRSNGLAVFAYLRESVAEAGEAGVPIDDVALGVHADFFPIRVELLQQILDYCIAVRLFARSATGALVAPANGDTRPQPAASPAQPPAAHRTVARAARVETASVVPAQPAGGDQQPAPKQETAQPKQETAQPKGKPRRECYLDGNVVRTRTVGDATAGAQPDGTVRGIRVEVPLWDGRSLPTQEELDNGDALKVCDCWNANAKGCVPVTVLTPELAKKLLEYREFCHKHDEDLYTSALCLCNAATFNAAEAARMNAMPPTLEGSLPDPNFDWRTDDYDFSQFPIPEPRPDAPDQAGDLAMSKIVLGAFDTAKRRSELTPAAEVKP